MNRSAYLTTGFAIKALSRLSKANIVIHGEENIPAHPTIFVINHFTRLETLLLPASIYNLTDVPVCSLADASLFKGGLEKFFDLVGVVSTADPKRDELIVKSLLTGEANWIIFPEGRMVKTKKIIRKGKFMIDSPGGGHEPHTGAAALALRAELFRNYLLSLVKTNSPELPSILDSLDLGAAEDIVSGSIRIVPVNLTYYPIRAMENIASSLAEKLVRDLSERMVEEIMTEGTMLLSGVDLDMRFGPAIEIEKLLDPEWVKNVGEGKALHGYTISGELKKKMRRTAYNIMQQYMRDIYAMTTVNHEHLYASFLRICPFERIKERDFRRRVFLAASLIRDRGIEDHDFYLHKSMEEGQIHLLTDDRFSKYENFIRLAEEKGVVQRKDGCLFRDGTKLSRPLNYHQGRIDNPIEIMANEVEPLGRLQKLIRSLAWQPDFLLKILLVRYLLEKERRRYRQVCLNRGSGESRRLGCLGKPFLLPAFRRRTGIVLVHSYLSVPEEVKMLALWLRRKGYWVYAPRLPGHGTSPEDLAARKYQEWLDSVERGYAIMDGICDRVIVGGVAVGGSLALSLASRIKEVAGVFAICPPRTLKDYSTKFMPTLDVWDRMLNRLKGEGEQQFLDFTYGNSHVNYGKNPVAGVHQVGEFLDSMKKNYGAISQPALIIQADENPVVDPAGAQTIYEKLGSREKEYCLLSFNRHVLVEGEDSNRVHRRISDFIEMI